MTSRLSAVLTTSAVVVTLLAGAVAWLRSVGHPRARLATDDINLVDNWREYAGVDARIGKPTAGVMITAFLDYTCPHSRDLLTTLTDILDQRSDAVALVVRHFPLSDEAPRDLAIAVECSRRGGALARFQQLLSDTMSIVQPNWTYLAIQAGISDTVAFMDCFVDSTAAAVVGRDLRAGYSLGVTRTPTLLMNDLLIEGNPPPSILRDIIAERSQMASARVGSGS
jgi:protein-disulfide isomerase